MEFQPIAPQALENVFRLIGHDWMLITAEGQDERGVQTTNTMTASWGGMGVLWNKPVAFCFIRPQRYTFALTEQSERFSLSFFTEDYRSALRLCGTVSGRDTDKFAAAGLTAERMDGVPYIKEARLVLICRKLYADTLKEGCFTDTALLDNYKDGDFHRVYVVQIEQAYIKEG
ncbi:MAG: flavin reductase family protein [Clostridia bacterium]|nr:flavin reductase family protein [Clostridia bacterium]